MDRSAGGGLTGKRRKALIVALAGFFFTTTGLVSSVPPAPSASSESGTAGTSQPAIGDARPTLNPAHTRRREETMNVALPETKRGRDQGGTASCRSSRRLCAPS
jgi:hypothetical protein